MRDTARMSSGPDTSVASRSRKEQARLAIAAVAGGFMLLFAVLNHENVKVHWVVTTSKTPLIVVIALSFVLGAAVGALVVKRRSA